MDMTRVIFGEDSDNKKDGTHSSSSSLSAADSFSGSANSGGGNGGGGHHHDEKNGEVADGSNTADSHQHDGDRDLFASDNEDHSKTLAKISHPIPGNYILFL
ncbi:unnamed protein product [Trifolium pratense]|uniref:Uncharacterized protein n=1 Tax=Trifolium pratense TaxID=57577 RepID=A0ACB0JNR5_TRIPR|nr:unnamed protein product [Trifolium pratense]